MYSLITRGGEARSGADERLAHELLRKGKPGSPGSRGPNGGPGGSGDLGGGRKPDPGSVGQRCRA